MRTQQTLEIRWFNQGKLPANIQQWFDLDCLGKKKQSLDSPEEREDDYLYLPNCQILSFKRREQNLEIKFRVNEFINAQNSDPATSQGNIERWIKLEYNQDILKNIDNFDNYKQQTWIKVKKKRWQRCYKKVNLEICHLQIAQNFWWTMAAEMKENPRNNLQHFKQVISEFSQTYSGQELTAKQSYAYPTWLLESFTGCL
ncbi:hypothetical protein [Gloeothece verrucosa]|uniref:Uncharacterized protein n=1 Tax=Gloeothece verrucosa (strain PCC 7822) TaxID=497965 RepID=E0UFW1_GLOV7|nr:hypothetical protein [Gloeothece verrucosa]ADN14344.1 conserved hypothetical protein [Gloeothece verrucosa PCC 7822]